MQLKTVSGINSRPRDLGARRENINFYYFAAESYATFVDFQTGDSEDAFASGAYASDRSSYRSDSSYALEFDTDDTADSDGEVDGHLAINVNAARTGRARGSPRVVRKPGKNILKSKSISGASSSYVGQRIDSSNQ